MAMGSDHNLFSEIPQANVFPPVPNVLIVIKAGACICLVANCLASAFVDFHQQRP
jgi:hypothetical protein